MIFILLINMSLNIVFQFKFTELNFSDNQDKQLPKSKII